MAIINALDIPPWVSNKPLSLSQLKNAKANGYDMLIGNLHTGTTNGTIMEETLRRARMAGMEIAAYYAVSSKSASWHFEQARRMAGEQWENLRFVAIDVELTWVKQQQVKDSIQLVIKAEQRPIIYTAAWFWKYTWGNPNFARNIPLWDADYDDSARFEAFNSYGGWTERVGKQYNSKAKDVDFLADANVFDLDFVLAHPQVPEFDLNTMGPAFGQEAALGRVTPVTADTNSATYQFTIPR